MDTGVKSMSYFQQYGGKSIYVTSGSYSSDQTVSGSLVQLTRVQSADYNIRYPLEDNIYTDGGTESFYLVPLGIDVTYRFYNTNGINERVLGLGKINNNNSLVLGLDEEKNAYIVMEDQPGVESIGSPLSTSKTAIGLSQGLLTQYTLSAAVGGFVESTATVNYISARTYTGVLSGLVAPSVNYQNGDFLTGKFVIPVAQTQYDRDSLDPTVNAAALGSREVLMMFAQGHPFGITYTGTEQCYLQSVNLNLAIDRREQKPLGNVFPNARAAMYPIKVQLDTDAIVSKYQSDALQRMKCAATTGHGVSVVIKQPCSSMTLFGFYFNNLQIDSQDITTSVGNMDRVRTSWRGFLKSPNDVFISPVFNYIYRDDNSGAYGVTW